MLFVYPRFSVCLPVLDGTCVCMCVYLSPSLSLYLFISVVFFLVSYGKKGFLTLKYENPFIVKGFNENSRITKTFKCMLPRDSFQTTRVSLTASDYVHGTMFVKGLEHTFPCI